MVCRDLTRSEALEAKGDAKTPRRQVGDRSQGRGLPTRQRGLVLAGSLALALAACRQNRPMADRVEMETMDTAMMADPMRADSMLDTMPGGEMVRGNDSAATRLLKKKM